jgi:hypothetical protein
VIPLRIDLTAFQILGSLYDKTILGQLDPAPQSGKQPVHSGQAIALLVPQLSGTPDARDASCESP